MDKFSRRLRTLRAESGLTQKELAKKLYMSVMTVRNCEEEKSFPRVDNLISFAVFFRSQHRLFTRHFRQERTTMNFTSKRKAHRKAGALQASYSKNYNCIIAHQSIFVKYSRSAVKTNYDLIRSLNLEEMAAFLYNFRFVIANIDNKECARKILERKVEI